MSSQNKKVFVAMSGGVDSSVSAALLKKDGYDVTGVFMRVWQPDFLSRAESRGIECQTNDRQDAMRAAAHLGIPFLTFDFEEEYKKEVIDYMIAEYKAGRTPNPDIMCNTRIKFGAFLKKAREMGADYIATGHYARLQREFPISNFQFPNKSKFQNSNFEIDSKFKIQNSKFHLLRAKDENKDQSYFLWTLTQEQLKYTLFPIGDYTKPEVRELARKFGLPNAERKESQGLCFVGEFKMQEFLEHFIPPKRGDVLNEKGEVAGYHWGAVYLTLGQRHGFTVVKKRPDEAPYYVVGKDVDKNTITVAHRRTNAEQTQNYAEQTRNIEEVSTKEVNFILGEAPDMGKEYRARFRYRQPLQFCRIKAQKNAERTQKNAETVIAFKRLQEAVAPGQSLVLYDKNGEECIGGGVIV